MHRALASVLASVALAAGPTTPARATTSYPGPGALCGFAAVSELTGFSSQFTGTIFGGPLVVLDDARRPSSGTLVCSIHVNGRRHADPAVVTTVASSTGAGSLAIGPYAVVTYLRGQDDEVVYCSKFVPGDGSPNVYWSDARMGGTGTWTTDANAPCSLATIVHTWNLQEYVDIVTGLVNEGVCPSLGCEVHETLPVHAAVEWGEPPVTG